MGGCASAAGLNGVEHEFLYRSANFISITRLMSLRKSTVCFVNFEFVNIIVLFNDDVYIRVAVSSRGNTFTLLITCAYG